MLVDKPLVAVVGLDDTRHDAGDRLDVFTVLKTFGREYMCHGTTLGPCWTSRTEWFTGLAWPRHCFNPTAGATATTEYDQTYNSGAKRISMGRPSVWAGPYNNSLAARMGLSDDRITQAAQAAMGILRSTSPGDTPDDLQRSSGSVFQEVARQGIPIAYLGKYNNQHRTTHNVPAGITKAHIQIMTADSGGQYDADLQEYEGPNPFDGMGISTGAANHYDYSRGALSNIGNWSPIGSGRVRVALASGNHKFIVSDIGQNVVVVDGCSIPQYNGVFKLVAIGANADGSSPDNTRCWFESPDFGTTTTGSGNLYNKTEMPIWKYAELAEEFIDDCVANDTPGLIWCCPHQTHSTAGGETPSSYGSGIEREYIGTVNPLEAPYFDGMPGNSCGTAQTPVTSTVQGVYEAVREEMLTVNEFLRRLILKMDTVRSGQWFIILTSDQGIQQGEQWSRGNDNIKTAVWEGSRRSFMIIMGPGITAGQFNRPTMHADIPATVLDMLGLTNNHMHISRDGVSLLRIVNPSHPAYNRYISNFGDYLGGSGQGYVGPDRLKYIRPTGVPSSGKNYDTRKPSEGGDYETAQLTPPDLAACNALTDALINAQMNNTTDSNPINDGSLVL